MYVKQQRGRKNLLFLAMTTFLLAGVMGLAFLDVEQALEPLLLVTLVAACLLPMAVAWLRGHFDVFEPVYYVSLVMFVYYGVAVALHIRDDSFVMLGIDYRSQVPQMLLLSTVAVFSFYVGYYGLMRTDIVADETALANDERYFLHRVAMALFAFFTLLVLLWIVVGRVPLQTLFIFGEASYGDWWEAAAGPRIGYFYAARESLAACLLLLIATRRSRHWPFHMIILLVLVAVFLAGTGGRSRVLLVAMSAWALFYLERRKQPGALQILLVAAVILYFIVGAIGFYRGPGRAVGEVTFTAQEAADVFISSSSIAVATAAKLYWIPEVVDFDLGRKFLEVFIQWIPGFIWPAKYQFFSNAVLDRYLSAGAATSYWFIWYSSFGVVGMVAGMVLLAWALRRIYERYLTNPINVFWMVTLALMGPYLIRVIGRGSPSQIFYTTVYIFSPVVLAALALRLYRARKNRLASRRTRLVSGGQQ